MCGMQTPDANILLISALKLANNFPLILHYVLDRTTQVEVYFFSSRNNDKLKIFLVLKLHNIKLPLSTKFFPHASKRCSPRREMAELQASLLPILCT